MMRHGFIFFTLCNGLTCSAEWSGPMGSVLYLFVPGFRQSERHATYYSDAYTASTGETLVCDSTLNTLPSTCYSFNFPEIRLIDIDGVYRPADVFSRLFSYVQQAALGFFDRIRGTRVLGEPVNGKSVKKHWVEASKISLGQKEDILCMSDTYDTYTASHKDGEPMVLYGASRGAATTFSFMGSSYLDKIDKRVRAVVLEGCYDSFDHVFSCYGRLKQLWYYKLAHSFIYDKDTKPVEPIDFVHTFPHDVPVLFIASQKDRIVPSECVRTLAHKLTEAGHEHVYLLELTNSSHIGYFCDDVVDTQGYRSVVHAFYAAYDLPHISRFACQGAALLKECKVS